MHDISSVTYFSEKSSRLMPPDALSLAQNAPKCVWRPGYARILWGSSQRSHRPPSWIQGVLLLRGREGNAPNFVSRFGGIEAPVRSSGLYILLENYAHAYLCGVMTDVKI